jgi:peptidoglycan-associated lipoprotein
MYARTQEILPMHLRLFFLALLALAGCAHEQAKVESTPAPVAVATPTPAPPPAAPAAESSADLEEFLSQPVAHFAFDRADLTPEDQLRLQVLAGLLRAQAGARIQLAGNCDERGTEEYNLQLGSRRAEVAKRYLVALGVGADRIETVSYGEERPIDPGHTETAWAANRRDDGQVLVGTASR